MLTTRCGWVNSTHTVDLTQLKWHICGAPIALKGGARGTIQGHGLYTANTYNLVRSGRKSYCVLLLT